METTNSFRKNFPEAPFSPVATKPEPGPSGEGRVKFVEKHQVLWGASKGSLPLIYAFVNDDNHHKIKLVIDTASGINLIKLGAIPEDTNINFEDHVKIHGIGPQTTSTLGSVTLTFFKVPAKFYVLPDGLLLPADGLVGTEFLDKSEAQVSFYHKSINFNTNPIKPIFFIENNEAEINIPARSQMVTQLYLKETERKTGYLPKVKLPEGIYAGESLVTNHEGICYTFIINTTGQEAQVRVPPQPLFEYEKLSLSETDPEEENQDPKEPRLDRILKSIKLDHLNETEKGQIVRLITEYQELFHLPGERLPATPIYQHEIVLKHDTPIFTKQFKYPEAHRNEVCKQVNKMLEEGIVQPSMSPYNSPLFVIPKKSNDDTKKFRLVHDLRQINAATVGNSYPLPDIDSIMSQLGGSKYFTVVDLASAFHQIEI